MKQITNFLTIYYVEVTISLIFAIFILFISIIILQYKYKKSMENYTNLVRGVKGIEIEELLTNINEDILDITNKVYLNQESIKKINTKFSFAIQKIGFVRYDAFRDMGSELSFSIALLDEFKNGFVYTSIYGRDNTFSYGKPIKNGASKIPLSAEEMLAIDRAIKGKKIENI